MTTPLSLEQRILIAAEYNADRVEVIKELMGEEAERFRQWLISEGCIEVLTDVRYKDYEYLLQSNKQVKP